MRLLLLATLVCLSASPLKAADLTLACLSVGQASEFCSESAARFARQSGHTVRVVSADPNGRTSLENYRALFDVQSPRIDVLQFPESWIPALGGDLATLPEPPAGTELPGILEIGRDAGRLVGLPQHVAVTLLFMRSDVLGDDPKAWSDLRDSLMSAPSDGANGLAFGAAGPTLFPLFLDWVYSVGASGLQDHDALLTALQLLNSAIGSVTTSGVTSTTAQGAINDFTSGITAALVARSTALTAVRSSAVAQDVATVLRPQGRGEEGTSPLLVSTWYTGVSRHSRSSEAATELAAFMTSEAEQRRAALAYGLAPTWRALYDEDDILAVNAVLRIIGESVDQLVAAPVDRYGANYLDLADDVGAAVRDMLNGEADPEATTRVIELAARRASRQVN